MDTGKLGVWTFFDAAGINNAAEMAARIEAMGYGTLWIPETVGYDPMVMASVLLQGTQSLNVATGIANIYHREPGVTKAAQNSLSELSGGRFLLGLGVSHKPLVEGVRGLEYKPPVATMRTYLEKMQAAPYSGPAPSEPPPLVIAALGPKMLELAAGVTQGAHPYFTTPEHTKMARDIMGPDAWICAEQKVILVEDADQAREIARPVAKIYSGLPNYRNNWLRLGIAESDINDLTDTFIDQTFAYGSAAAIQSRIDAHLEAGASHVCIQPINPSGNMGELHWETLEALAP